MMFEIAMTPNIIIVAAVLGSVYLAFEIAVLLLKDRRKEGDKK